MSKILSVIEKTAQSGKAYYILTCEGMDKQIISFSKLALGADVNPDNLVLNDKGDTWKFKSGTDGKTWQDKKGAYQRNDDLIIAQVAYKGILELVNGGKLEPHDITETMIIRHGVWIKKAADMIRIMTDPAYNAKTPAPVVTAAPADKTATAQPQPEIDLKEILACNWSTFEKKDFDQALAGMARAKKLSPESAKAFLVDQFGIESSSMIPIGQRNNVIHAMAELAVSK